MVTPLSSPGTATLSESETNVLAASGTLDPSQPNTTLQFTDGRVIVLPTSLLFPSANATEPSIVNEEAVSIPIVEEQLAVGKRTIETGKVTLEKLVHEYEETLDVPLAIRSFDIERVVVNRPVDAAPQVRHEGDTTVYPLVEEQLILTTQLILKEELRVTKRDTERRDTRTVTLKRESIEVTRTPTA